MALSLSTASTYSPSLTIISQERPDRAFSQILFPETNAGSPGVTCLHLFTDEEQYMPVVSAPVHAAFPQMQGAALLGADPSVFVQAGAVRVHMHVRDVEHEYINVEDVFVLKYRKLLL